MGGSFKDDSAWILVRKCSIICLAVGFVLFLVSYGAPNWAESNPLFAKRRDHIGLWRQCSKPQGGGETCDDFINIGNYGDWLKATQSFMTLALFGLIASVGVYAVYLFVDDFQDDVRLLACALGTSGMTGVFLLISVGVFGSEYCEWFMSHDGTNTADVCKLAWAWYLALISMLLTFTAPILVILDLIFGSNT